MTLFSIKWTLIGGLQECGGQLTVFHAQRVSGGLQGSGLDLSLVCGNTEAK